MDCIICKEKLTLWQIRLCDACRDQLNKKVEAATTKKMFRLREARKIG